MSSGTSAFDTRKRYVRVTRERANGFIEFEFAIGEPELCVELILSRAAFDEFCANTAAIRLEAQEDAAPRDDWSWRMSDATSTRFR